MFKPRSKNKQQADKERFLAAEQTLLTAEGVDSTSRRIELARSNTAVRVQEAGASDGPPIVFVPGVMTGGAVFARLVARLPEFRCIMLDRPGVALNPRLDPPPQTLADHERLGDDLLVDVLDGLGLQRSHVVSTSLGGWTTVRSMAAHPERFISHVGLAFQVGATIEKLPLSMRMPVIDWMIPNRVPATPRIVRAMMKSAGMRSAVDSGKFSEELASWLVAMFSSTDTFGNETRDNADLIKNPHSPELLASVNVPVHLFWGADDIFSSEKSARSFAEALPNATLQMVPNAGHAPWIDEPDLAAAAVRQHFTTHAG